MSIYLPFHMKERALLHPCCNIGLIAGDVKKYKSYTWNNLSWYKNYCVLWSLKVFNIISYVFSPTRSEKKRKKNSCQECTGQGAGWGRCHK
jgi:hypothetical protein